MQIEGATRDLKGQAKGAFKDAKGDAKGKLSPATCTLQCLLYGSAGLLAGMHPCVPSCCSLSDLESCTELEMQGPYLKSDYAASHLHQAA